MPQIIFHRLPLNYLNLKYANLYWNLIIHETVIIKAYQSIKNCSCLSNTPKVIAFKISKIFLCFSLWTNETYPKNKENFTYHQYKELMKEGTIRVILNPLICDKWVCVAKHNCSFYATLLFFNDFPDIKWIRSLLSLFKPTVSLLIVLQWILEQTEDNL